jgi:hypothetical protein
MSVEFMGRTGIALVHVIAVCLALSACANSSSAARDDRRASDATSGGSMTSNEQATNTQGMASLIDDPEALAVIARHPRFGGRALVPLVEARAGTRSAIVVWPVFTSDSTRPVSDDPVGVTLDLGPDGTLSVIDAGWNPRDRTGRALALQLGTDRYERVDRSEGASLDALPARIREAFDHFRAACRAADRARAIAAARAMASLFAWEVLAFEDVVTEMLWAASTGDYQLEHRATELLDEGRRARVSAVIIYRGTPHSINVIATPRDPARTRWIISSEGADR